MRDADDDLDDLRQRFGWASDEEREAALAETAERERRNKSLETLQWAIDQNEKRREAERAAAVQPPKRDWKGRSVMATKTDQWTAFIDQRIRIARKASQKSLLGAVGDVLGEEIDRLRKENQTLRAALADVTARLEKLEQIERGSASLHQLRAITSGS